MTHIHWLGAGLSSGPGLRRLANAHEQLTAWNRTVEKAEKILAGCPHGKVRPMDLEELNRVLEPGDVVISMLPAAMHLEVARRCMANNAHFVSSSYLSPDMGALDGDAKSRGLCLVNEVGLDPGIDHLLAHDLVAGYRGSPVFDTHHDHYFRSYCGGFPSVPNDFKYKFSWSPLGVLRALKTPARWIEGGREQTTDIPWHALSSYQTPLPGSESFQAYPNRDSVPFAGQYHLAGWNLRQFVRGTLRLQGWAEAWSDIFSTLEQLHGDEANNILEEMSEELWQKYAYQEGEPDRVVLCVELEARGREGAVHWRQSYSMDERGNAKGSAMARLVSLPISLAVDSIVSSQIPAGVSTAPDNPEIIREWFGQLTELGETIVHRDHVTS